MDIGGMADVSAALDALRSHAERMHELSERMREIRAEETSSDGAITVIVNGEGRLMDIRLSHSISRLTSVQFGQRLTETSQAAARQAMEKQAALVAEFNGTGQHGPDPR